MSRAIFKHSTVVGLVTLLSRVTGLVRDVAIAQAFASAGLRDAFLVAFKIPNFLRRLYAEGSFSQAFVPVISEYRQLRSPEEVRALISASVGTLGVCFGFIALAGVAGAPFLVRVYAPGFAQDPAQLALTIQLVRFTFPYLVCVMITALLSSVLNSYERFALPVFTQVALNLMLIFTALVLAMRSSEPGQVLAIGVLAAGSVQVLLQLPALKRLGLLGWPRWQWDHEGVRRMFARILPGIVGSSMLQLSLVLDTVFASLLATGSVSWLYFADRLMEFPLGLVGIALATVTLPGLAKLHTQGSVAAFSRVIDFSLRLTLLLAVPAAIGLLCFSGPITASVFGYRHFSAFDVQMAAAALAAYAPALMMFSLVKVLVPGFFARHDTGTPVRAGLVGLGVNVALNAVLSLTPLKTHLQAPHILLALSTGVGATLNALLLWQGLRRAGVYQPEGRWLLLLLRIGIACAAMAAFLLWFSGPPEAWLLLHAGARILHCSIGIAGGALAYGLVLLLLGLRYRDVFAAPL
ncbi:MAG: murein biosynthesis integral membrane protein MurJ [Steroidobacteraceae bacterium]|jgi:putative peptidoglycan lipid II flippase